MSVLGKLATEAILFAAGDQLSRAITKQLERKNPMAGASVTKQQLQQAYDELHETVSNKLDELLNPILTREEIVEGLQELQSSITDEEDEEDEEGYDESDEDE